MSEVILDGKATAQTIKNSLAQRVTALKAKGINPGLGTILVGDDAGSHAYVNGKHKDCAEVGISSIRIDLPKTATQTDVIRNLTHNTSRYTKALTIIESRFFETLVGNPTLGSLACMDQDPDKGNQPFCGFYLLCCG